MFMLEAIKAKHGDCLLLHWGTENSPKLALIDGGPDKIYKTYLKPRLKSLAKARGKPQIKLDLTMVSHIDDDHINGILDLADDIEIGGGAPADIGLLWFNSLEHLLNEKIAGSAKATAAVGAAVKDTPDEWYGKVLASVPQGQQLHAFAKRHKIFSSMNHPYDSLVLVEGRKGPTKIAGLTLKVIAPFANELETLRKKWKQLRKTNITAAFSDPSPYNLSSIVVLAEYEGKKALLTGDARGDKILEGLKARKLLKNGKCHVDLLKLPHHGSQNNTTKEFFETVTADVYVVSGDHKKFPNPHKKAMQWLADARGNEEYTVYCTYKLPYMGKLFKDRLIVPSNGASSVMAEL